LIQNDLVRLATVPSMFAFQMHDDRIERAAFDPAAKRLNAITLSAEVR